MTGRIEDRIEDKQIKNALARISDDEIQWIDRFVAVGWYNSRASFVVEALRQFTFVMDDYIRIYLEEHQQMDEKNPDYREIYKYLLETFPILKQQYPRTKTHQLTLRIQEGLMAHIAYVDMFHTHLGFGKYVKVATTARINYIMNVYRIPEDLDPLDWGSVLVDEDALEKTNF